QIHVVGGLERVDQRSELTGLDLAGVGRVLRGVEDQVEVLAAAVPRVERVTRADRTAARDVGAAARPARVESDDLLVLAEPVLFGQAQWEIPAGGARAAGVGQHTRGRIALRLQPADGDRDVLAGVGVVPVLGR